MELNELNENIDHDKCNFHIYNGIVFCNLCGTKAVRTRFGDEFSYWCNYKGCENEEMCSHTKLVEAHKKEMKEKFNL